MEIVSSFSNENTPVIFNSEYTIETLKVKNKELSTDVSILKRLVYMLNVELESRDSGSNNRENRRELFFDRETRNNGLLKSEDIRMIEPLLEAFQQTIEEKDQLIANYKQSFNDFSHHCKEIILENDVLRQQLQELKQKSESTCAEWKKLHDEFLLIEEHNQLLTRQTKLFHDKIRSIESVYQRSVKQIESEKRDLSEKHETTKTELLMLKGRFSVLSDVNNQFKSYSDHQNELNLYGNVVKELKNLSIELKLHHTSEIEILKKKIKALETEKCEMEIRLATVSSERDHLQGYISVIELQARKLNSKYEELMFELQNAKKDQGDAKKQVIKCMTFIRELIGAHNSLLNQISVNHEEKRENI